MRKQVDERENSGMRDRKESRGGRFFSGSMDDENVGERQSTALNVVQLSHRRHVCERSEIVESENSGGSEK